MEGAVGSTELWQVWKHNFSTIKLDPIFRNRTHGLRVDANRLKVVYFWSKLRAFDNWEAAACVQFAKPVIWR